MRRSFTLLMTCLLALATGLALLGLGTLIARPALKSVSLNYQDAADAANTALVQRFYEAVNATLRAGDPTPLAALLATDFADRTAPFGFAMTRDGLLQHVMNLRATFPAMLLTAEDLLVRGDWVLARVWVVGAADGSFLGVPLAGPPANWEGRDLIRIANGRIAERWSAGEGPILPALLGEALIAEPTPTAVLRVARFTFAPDARRPQLVDLGPLLLAVEAGTLVVRSDGPTVRTRDVTAGVDDPPTIESSGTDITLQPGDGLLISRDVRYELRSTEAGPAVLLAATLLPWQGTGPAEGGAFVWPVPGAPNITAELLIDAEAIGIPPEPVVLGLGRLSLAAGVVLEPYAATGPQFVFVETGTLSLATSDGDAHRSAGSQVRVELGAAATLRNTGDGPLVVLLLTISPAAPAPTTGVRPAAN